MTTKFLNISTDNTLGGNNPSNSTVPSEKAIKEYVDNHGGGGGGTNVVGTLHNNLFDFRFYDYEIDLEGWVRADTFEWYSSNSYSDAYNHLVEDISGITSSSETIGSYTITYYQATDGHKVVLADQETALQNIYTESGVAWYYLLDTANQRFKLPRLNPAREELIEVIRAKGNGITLGFTDGTNNLGATFAQNGGYTGWVFATSGSYGGNVGDNVGAVVAALAKQVGVTTDSTKSGIVSDMTDSTSVFKGNKYLYFYVGEQQYINTEATQQAETVTTQVVETIQTTPSDIEDVLKSITGYDATKTQTLKHVQGVVQWVDN